MAHEDYSHPEYLVDPDWLAAHIERRQRRGR